MIKNNIRREIGRLLETLIPAGKWEEYIDYLDRNGKFDNKKKIAIAIITCKHIEMLETQIEDLTARLEQLEKPTKAHGHA